MMFASRIRRPLLVGAAYLSLAFAIAELTRHALVDADTAARLAGIAFGLFAIVTANAIPKKLVPLDRLSCDPAREQALRRFCAWALVLGGAGYLLAYALAPLAIMATLAISLLAPPTLVVAAIAARCAWKRRSAA